VINNYHLGKFWPIQSTASPVAQPGSKARLVMTLQKSLLHELNFCSAKCPFFLRYQVLMAASMEKAVFWDVTAMQSHKNLLIYQRCLLPSLSWWLPYSYHLWNAGQFLQDWLTNKQTPWHQNLKVYHRIHKSPPPVPILSQLDPLCTPPANLPKSHSDPILPSMPQSSKRSLSFWSTRLHSAILQKTAIFMHLSFLVYSMKTKLWN
jgi:hypothetical protein